MKTGNEPGANWGPRVSNQPTTWRWGTAHALQPAEQLSRPGARGQNQRARLVTATLGFDLDAVSDRLPATYWLVLAHVSPKCAGLGYVRDDGAVGREEAGFGLVHRFELRWQLPGGIAPRHLACAQDLVREVVFAACLLGSRNDAPGRQTDIEAARHGEQPFAEIALQRLPARERQAHERHVARMLEVSEAEDARRARRGAQLMRN